MVSLIGVYDGEQFALPVGDKDAPFEGYAVPDTIIADVGSFSLKVCSSDVCAETSAFAPDDSRGARLELSLDVGYFYTFAALSNSYIMINGKGWEPAAGMFARSLAEGKVGILTVPGTPYAFTQGNGGKLVRLPLTADVLAGDLMLAVIEASEEVPEELLVSQKVVAVKAAEVAFSDAEKEAGSTSASVAVTTAVVLEGSVGP